MRRAALIILPLLLCLMVVSWADESTPTVLDDVSFRFCHENRDFEYNETFCALLEDLPEDRCPGLREFCAAPGDAPSSGCSETSAGGGSGPGSTPAGGPEAPSGFDPAIPKGCDYQAPSLNLGPVLMWVVAFAVALGIGAVLILLLRYIGLRPDTPSTPTVVVPLGDEEEQDFAEAVSDVPDLPSADLLGAARAALQEGRLGEAAVLARGSVLRELGERRVLKLHRARTDRDYVRQSSHDPDLREVLEVAERHRWGRRPLVAAAVGKALEAAARLLATAMLLLFASTAYGFDRFGPAGDAGLQRVLNTHGIEASFRLRSLADPGDKVDVILIDTSGLSPTDEDWESLRSWVESGHVLVVAGTPVGFPEIGERVTSKPPYGLRADLEQEGLVAPRWPTGPSYGFDGGDPWLLSEQGISPIVSARVGDGAILAIADPVLLWNGSLIDPVNEAFIGEMLYRGQARGWPMQSPIRAQLATMAGSTDDNPAAALANLRLLPLVLQVLLFWTVLVASRGWPFAPLREGKIAGRRAFSEHVDAVARHYKATRSTRHITAAYCAWALERYRRPGLMIQARRHGMSDADGKALVDRIEQFAETPEGANDRSDPEFLEEVWKLTRRQ